MKPIIRLTCASDWDGQAMSPSGTIGLRRIIFNRTEWEADHQMSSIILPDQGELILRRDGYYIYITR